MLRRAKYAEFLAEAKLLKLNLNDLLVLNNPLFIGEPVQTPSRFSSKIIYSSRDPCKLHIVVKDNLSENEVEELKEELKVSGVKAYSEDQFRNIYVALSDGYFDYPALLLKVDFNSMEALVKTKFNGEPRVIKFSSIKLNEDFVEEFTT